jgi:hypothetical protein
MRRVRRLPKVDQVSDERLTFDLCNHAAGYDRASDYTPRLLLRAVAEIERLREALETIAKGDRGDLSDVAADTLQGKPDQHDSTSVVIRL